MAIKKDKWIEKLIPNVNEIPHLEVLIGYIGSGKSDDYIRIYHEENLRSYSEVANVDIVHVESRDLKEFPLGGSYVWVNKNSEIDRSSDRGKSSQKGKFLASESPTTTNARGYTDSGWYTCNDALTCECTKQATVCQRTCDNHWDCNRPYDTVARGGFTDTAFSCDCTTYDQCTNGPVCKTVRTHCGATICEETCSGLKTCNPNNIFCRPKGQWDMTENAPGGRGGFTDTAFSCDCTTYDQCTNGPVCKTVRTHCGATICEETCSGLKTCNPNNIFCRPKGHWDNTNHPYRRRNW